MTLNPSAQVFVPSSNTNVRLLENSTPPALVSKKSLMNHEYPPPQLESLYVDPSQTTAEVEVFSQLSESVSKRIDYTNFDLPFFFHDMMSADSEDFANYLSDRAEYLLGYAGTSQTHALEIVDTILDTVFNLLRKNGKEFKRPLKLAAEMCDMDGTFLQMMLQQMIRLLDFLRVNNPRVQDLAYSVLLGLILSELHIGTCVAPPETAGGFVDEVCELFISLLQEKQQSTSAAIFALEQCHLQLRAMCTNYQIENLCSALRKVSLRFISTELFSKLSALQKALRQRTPHLCLKAHAIPVAQLNEEESQDFEAFLQEARDNFFKCRG